MKEPTRQVMRVLDVLFLLKIVLIIEAAPYFENATRGIIP